MTTEDELVRAIKKVLSGDHPGVVVPVGDDAAVVDADSHHLVLTVDTLVEGVHFDAEAMPAHDIGHKAVTVNVSDVAAMGGSPRYAVVSLATPGDVPTRWVMEVYGGIREAADDYGMGVVGGDTVRAEQRVLTVTVLGRVARDRAVTRAGARPGDRIVVTGSLGAAAGGVRLLGEDDEHVRMAIESDWGRDLLQALFRPSARVGEGETLAQGGATAMIDISDGLALDLSRICEAGEVGARIETDAIPVSPLLETMAGAVDGLDPLDLALHGGEDYELLATISPEAVEHVARKVRDRYGTEVAVIGEVTEGGLVAVGPDGRERPLEPRGWDHFG